MDIQNIHGYYLNLVIHPWITPWISTKNGVNMYMPLDGIFCLQGKPENARFCFGKWNKFIILRTKHSKILFVLIAKAE